MQVYLSQRNLPSNSQRKYTVNLALPATPGEGATLVPAMASLPVELPSDLLFQAPAPSGKSPSS